MTGLKSKSLLQSAEGLNFSPVILLYSHVHAEYILMQWIKMNEDFFKKKIYLSLYLKGLCVRGSWRPNRTAIYWSPLLWPSALCLSRSPGLLNRRAGGPLCWVLAFSTTSCHQRVSNLNWFPVFIELYNSSIAHSISLEWHVRLSSSRNNCHAVHRSLFWCISLWLYHQILPSPILSAKPAYAISSHNCHRNVSLPSGASLWNGMFGRIEGQYTTI